MRASTRRKALRRHGIFEPRLCVHGLVFTGFPANSGKIDYEHILGACILSFRFVFGRFKPILSHTPMIWLILSKVKGRNIKGLFGPVSKKT